MTAALAGAVAHILYLHSTARPGAQIGKVPFERAQQSFDRVVQLVPDDAPPP